MSGKLANILQIYLLFNSLIAGPRYIRDCCLMLERGMVFALALEWARRCFKNALDGKLCTIEIQILHKNVSHIV